MKHCFAFWVRTSLAAAFLFAPLTAQAQTDTPQFWTTVSLTKSLPRRRLVYAELQPRLREQGDLEQFIARTAYGYRLNSNTTLWLGYGWTPNYEPRSVNENRIYQQLQWSQRWRLLDVTNRTRLEQRFIERADGVSVRGRHLLRGLYSFDPSRKWESSFRTSTSTTSTPYVPDR